jgi:hypothetical protein
MRTKIGLIILMCLCVAATDKGCRIQTDATKLNMIQAAFPQGDVKALPTGSSANPMWAIRNPDGSVWCATIYGMETLVTNIVFKSNLAER